MALVEIKFAPWSSKAAISVEVGDGVRPMFRLRAALEIVVGEVKEGKRDRLDLRGADLRDADLSDADLSGADLSDAVLRGADLRGADLRDILEKTPLIPNIDAAILAAIEANKAAGTNGLEMRSWHGDKTKANVAEWCQTTHCRAGYAVCLAGEAGFALEKKYGSANAGMFLYLKSTPNEPTPDWGASNEAAMADMKARAARQTGGAI